MKQASRSHSKRQNRIALGGHLLNTSHHSEFSAFLYDTTHQTPSLAHDSVISDATPRYSTTDSRSKRSAVTRQSPVSSKMPKQRVSVVQQPAIIDQEMLKILNRKPSTESSGLRTERTQFHRRDKLFS